MQKKQSKISQIPQTMRETSSEERDQAMETLIGMENTNIRESSRTDRLMEKVSFSSRGKCMQAPGIKAQKSK